MKSCRWISVLSLATLGLLALPVLSSAQASGASLSILKIDAPDPVAPGSNLTYTLTASNEGPDDAADTILSDTLPAGTTFVTLAAPGGWSCTTPAVGAPGTVSCSLSSFPVGSAVFTLTVNVGAGVPAGTLLSNTATVTSSTADPQPGDESATVMTTVGAANGGLALSITGSPDPVLVGTDETYTITLTSTLTDATDGTLTVPVPGGTTFQSFTPPAGWSCATPPVGAGGSVVCGNPSPPAPGVDVFTSVVRVGPSFSGGDTFDGLASLVLSTGGRDVVATDTDTTSVLAPASLSATKSVSGVFTPGGAVTYTVVLSNAGPGAQADAPTDEFTDVLPASLVLVSASASAGTATVNAGTNTVTWNGTVPANGSVTITLDATIAPGAANGTTISNQGTVSYDSSGDGTNDASAPTDDPAVGGVADPTQLTVSALAAVPTLGHLGLVVLTTLLAAGGLLRLRRRAGA